MEQQLSSETSGSFIVNQMHKQESTTSGFVYDTEKPVNIIKQPPQLLPLFNENNPLLLKRMPEIDLNSPPSNLKDIITRLFDTMNHYGGAGLAANQCGISLRMFVMPSIVVINPEILEVSKEEVRSKEGCLTYPGLILPITRPETIKVAFYDAQLKRQVVTYSGVTARVFQHEYDHLEGKVFTSKVGSLTLQMAKKKKQKLFKKIERIVEYKKRMKG